MKIVEAYKSANGELHNDKLRAAAADLHHAMPRSDGNPNSKVLDHLACLRILEHRAIIQKVFADFDEMGQIELPLDK